MGLNMFMVNFVTSFLKTFGTDILYTFLYLHSFRCFPKCSPELVNINFYE